MSDAGSSRPKASPHTQKSVKEKKTKAKGPWGHCAARVCKSCLQSTHEKDRDTGEYLKWVFKRFSVKEGCEVPNGTACYPCFNTLRDFQEHGKVIKLQDLVEKMKEDTGLEATFLQRRREKLTGVSYNKPQEKVDVAELAKKKSTVYGKLERQGNFEELWSFAKSRKLKFKPGQEQELTQFIKQKYNPKQYKVGVVEGIMGVKIFDSVPGKFRFTEGMSNELEIQGPAEELAAGEERGQRLAEAKAELHGEAVYCGNSGGDDDDESADDEDGDRGSQATESEDSDVEECPDVDDDALIADPSTMSFSANDPKVRKKRRALRESPRRQ